MGGITLRTRSDVMKDTVETPGHAVKRSPGRRVCNGPGVIGHLRTVTTFQPKANRGELVYPHELRFAAVYRDNAGAVTSFFARRCSEPQDVADLTSQTFVEALRSAHSYEGRGSPRAWLLAIARTVYARYRADEVNATDLVDRLGGQLSLEPDEFDDLLERIDAQRDGRALLARAAELPELERAALELVDLAGLKPKEAAVALNVSAGALRVRLFRARKKLRKDGLA